MVRHEPDQIARDAVAYARGAPPSGNGDGKPLSGYGTRGKEVADDEPDIVDTLSVKMLPRIDAGNGDLAVVTEQAWRAIEAGNHPPTLFRYGALPSRVENDDEGNPVVRAMTLDRMRHRLARDADFFQIVKKGKSEQELPVPPPLHVVKDVLATPDPKLPVLTRIVECPVFAADGSLQIEPGYSPASKTLYVPAPGLKVPDVPQQPTPGDINTAKNLLMEIICDFPFVGASDKAHAMAACLLPFAREIISGPTPLHDFEAPTPGTGKTLLVNALTYPAAGRPLAAMTEGRDEDEWRKRIFAKLSSAPSAVLIDNVRRRVDASALASVLTAYPLWEDRLLGKSEIIRVPVRNLWLMTGNNPAFSSEMTRRTVRIRLDAKQDQPWLREKFKHKNLNAWTRDNRSQLVWAALTLIQAWLANGRPSGAKTLGMFEQWAATMGGILAVARIDGFLESLQDFYATADAEGQAWRAFVGAWWNQFGGENPTETRPVKAAELYTIATDAGLDLGDKGEQSQKIRLGKRLAEARDRVFTVQVTDSDTANLRVCQAGELQRAATWKIELRSE